MPKFIEIDNKIINIENIREVEFISDDIYLELFPMNAKRKITVDYVPFNYGKVKLFEGEDVDMVMHLYAPEESEDHDYWRNINRAYINESWGELLKALDDITRISNFEYRDI